MSKKYQDKSKINSTCDKDYIRRKEVLTSFFLDSKYVPMTLKQISKFFNVKKDEIDMLENILNDLELEGIVYIDDSKRYVLLSNTSKFEKCIYKAKSSSYGFGITSLDEYIYIGSGMSNGAMDGDDVLVEILKEKIEDKKREGRIVKILKRNTVKLIGRFIKSKNFGFVEPIDDKLDDIYIPKKFSQNIKDGSMVEVKIKKYATKTSKAEGCILSIIGNENTKNIEVEALYKSYGLDKMEKFNKLVESELKKIPSKVSENEKIGREDRTKEKVYTIDGEDAKDLDDGVFVKKINDKYILSVYIADVSHYVKDGTNLDLEALTRGTSIYIPGTVIPMLPKKLSNGICSLNEGVERLSLAIDIIYDSNGNVLDSNIFKAVIKVTKKMSYEKVYKVLNNQDEEVLKEYKDYIDDIFLMKELALILNKKRRENGSINFDIPDTKIVLDENGEVIDVKPYNKTIANDIIEEFMLAANMCIAKTFFFLDAPFIYRIHEKPDEEKLRDLNLILANYKKRIKGIKNIQPKVLSKLLDDFSSEEEKEVVSKYMLRSLKLAKYSNECEGHFGLAAKYYCHFTSPIRRYPDLFIHRVISDYLDNGYTLPDEKYSKYMMQAPRYATISSEAEKQATNIERDFDDLYKVIYMERFIGNEFFGIVSSVNSFGMFVKLENTVEGLVPFEKMPGNDYYIYDEVRKILVGKNTNKTFKVGDRVKVELIKCDVKSKQIDFSII